MIAASANWTNETFQGSGLSLADLLPPSSRQDLISTLPGVAPQSSAPPPPYSSPCSSRPMAETQGCSGPISSLADPNQTLCPNEMREEQHTDWCVDFGSVLVSMDTFELWAALDRGDVRSEMRVWREGMECWTPIGRVPELALALSSASSRTPEPVAFDAAWDGPLSSKVPITLLPPDLRDFEPPFTPPRDEPRPRLETLVSGPQQSGWERISEKILPPPTRKRASAHFWVALGSAVAATAITAAVISAEPPRADLSSSDFTAATAAPASAPSIAAVELTPAPTPTTAAAAAPSEPEPTAAAVAPPPRPAPVQASVLRANAPRAIQPRPRHDERGQHRLRRSGRQPYGW
jgi:hypothetical protein